MLGNGLRSRGVVRGSSCVNWIAEVGRFFHDVSGLDDDLVLLHPVPYFVFSRGRLIRLLMRESRCVLLI
jgi:hypothetical protein